jgi:hypothetical protein
MKKLMAVMLALWLAMPANAWHLFSVREKVVEVQKTNYLVTAITLAVGVVASIVTYLIGKGSQLNKLRDAESRTARTNLISQMSADLTRRGNWSIAFDNHDHEWRLGVHRNGIADPMNPTPPPQPLRLTVQAQIKLMEYLMANSASDETSIDYVDHHTANPGD